MSRIRKYGTTKQKLCYKEGKHRNIALEMLEAEVRGKQRCAYVVTCLLCNWSYITTEGRIKELLKSHEPFTE